VDISEASEPLAVRRGRRRTAPTGEGARDLIVEAARVEFGQNGYDATSFRAVARRAGVDAALVHHYFDEKADLFAATINVPIRPDRVVAEILRGPRDAVGASIVRSIISQLDQPVARDAIIATIRTALGHEFAARMLRQFLVREVLGKIAAELHVDDAELRASFAASQVVGLIMARYGLRLGPLTDAPNDEIVARVGPVVQWYLVGDRMTPPGS
jgi:AcrR family transcriptional regulator